MKRLKRDLFIVAIIFAMVAFRRDIMASLPASITGFFIKNDDRIIDLSKKIRYKGIPEVKETGKITNSLHCDPFFTDGDKKTTADFLVYAKTDMLKRPGQAFACISSKTLSDTDIAADSKIQPTGWMDSTYPKIIPGKFLYKKCHTVSSRLVNTIDDTRENTFIGTQYMYEMGLKKQEDKVIKYLKKNPENHVLYRVTPIYMSGNKIAKHVVVEAYSIEDKGKLSFCVAIHNEQPGVLIYYANGKNQYRDPDSVTEADKQIPIPKVKSESNKTHKRKTDK